MANPYLVAGATAAFNTISNVVAGNASSRKQYTNNRKLMRYANEINTENWNKVNDYNTPINQKKRMLMAGVNPNFSDFSSNSVASDISPVNALGVDAPDYGKDAVLKGVQSAQALQQTEKLQADTELTNKQAEGQELMNLGQEIKNEQDQFNLEQDKQFKFSERTMGLNKTNQEIIESNQRVSEMIQNIQTLISQQKYNEAQALLSKAVKETEDITRQAKLENIQSTTAVNKAEEKAIPERVAIGKQEANTHAREAEISAGRLAFDRQMGAWQREYEGRMLSIENLRNKYLNDLTDAQTSHEWLKGAGTMLDNGIKSFDKDLREYVHNAGLDTNREILLNGQLRMEQRKMEAEIREIDARKDLTEEQKNTEKAKQVNLYMNSAGKLVETAVKTANPFNAFTSKETPQTGIPWTSTTTY